MLYRPSHANSLAVHSILTARKSINLSLAVTRIFNRFFLAFTPQECRAPTIQFLSCTRSIEPGFDRLHSRCIRSTRPAIQKSDGGDDIARFK